MQLACEIIGNIFIVYAHWEWNAKLASEFGIMIKIIFFKTFLASKNLCEPFVPWVEHLFQNLFKLSKQLQELGFTYYNGKVLVIDVVDNE